MRRYLIPFLMAFSFMMSCTAKKTDSQQSEKVEAQTRVPRKSKLATSPVMYDVRHYDSAQIALKTLVEMKKPDVIGFGELHQNLATQDTASALKRFSDILLPAIADTLSDIVVETWQPVGCGKVEKKVVAEVKEVIERPKTTESEVVALLKQAKSLGVQPHILKVGCKDYDSLFISDGGTMDAYLMLKLVARLLKEKGLAVYKSKGIQTIKKDAPKKAVAIYGGAIHNDPHPEEGWEEVVFGPDVFTASQGRYIAIDLYVPEYIEADELTKEEKWYATYKQYVSKDKVTLIKINKNSYHLILKQGLKSNSGP